MGRKAEKELLNFLTNKGGKKITNARDYLRLKNIVDRTRDGLRDGRNVQLSKAELDILRKAGFTDTAEAYNGLMRKHTNPELLDRWERIHGGKFDKDFLSEPTADYYDLRQSRSYRKDARKRKKKSGLLRKQIKETEADINEAKRKGLDTSDLLDDLEELRSNQKYAKRKVKSNLKESKKHQLKYLESKKELPKKIEEYNKQRERTGPIIEEQERINDLYDKAQDKAIEIESYSGNTRLIKNAVKDTRDRYKKSGETLSIRGFDVFDDTPYFNPYDREVNIPKVNRRNSAIVLHELGHAENARKMGLDNALRIKAQRNENPHNFYFNGKPKDIINHTKREISNSLGTLMEEDMASSRAKAQAKKLGATKDELKSMESIQDTCLDTYKLDAAKKYLDKKIPLTARRKS